VGDGVRCRVEETWLAESAPLRALDGRSPGWICGRPVLHRPVLARPISLAMDVSKRERNKVDVVVADGNLELSKRSKAMAVLATLLASGLGFYLHRLPEFTGKRRALALFKDVVKGIPVRSHYGVTLRIDPGDRTNWHCVTGHYGEVVANEIKKLQDGDCFIDIGANCGIFSLLARERVGPSGVVIAFEPYFDTFFTLVSNIQLNGYQNVYPINVCVSDHAGVLKLNEKVPHHSGLGSVALEGDAAGMTAPCTGIDEFPAILHLVGNRNTIIKIDVEGYEVTVLRGLQSLLRRRNTKRIIIEIDNEHLARYQATAEELYGFVCSFGFDAMDNADRADRHFDEIFYRD